MQVHHSLQQGAKGAFSPLSDFFKWHKCQSCMNLTIFEQIDQTAAYAVRGVAHWWRFWVSRTGLILLVSSFLPTLLFPVSSLPLFFLLESCWPGSACLRSYCLAPVGWVCPFCFIGDWVDALWCHQGCASWCPSWVLVLWDPFPGCLCCQYWSRMSCLASARSW